MKDEWGIVLDFLPKGHPTQRKEEPIVQLLGERYFSLLEVVPRDAISFELGERVYIGEGKREKVKYIKRSITYDDLTSSAKVEVEEQVERMVEEEEDRFVKLFNEAGPLTTRMHSLEVLHGVGKKHLWEIIDERKIEKFKSYEDIKERVSLLPDPKKILVKRILEELSEEKKHYLFALSKRKTSQR